MAWRDDSDDDDDIIPAENPHPASGLCWSCQEPMSGTGRPVCLNPDALVPVCPECWSSMTTFERLTIAIQFSDREDDLMGDSFDPGVN